MKRRFRITPLLLGIVLMIGAAVLAAGPRVLAASGSNCYLAAYDNTGNLINTGIPCASGGTTYITTASSPLATSTATPGNANVYVLSPALFPGDVQIAPSPLASAGGTYRLTFIGCQGKTGATAPCVQGQPNYWSVFENNNSAVTGGDLEIDFKPRATASPLPIIMLQPSPQLDGCAEWASIELISAEAPCMLTAGAGQNITVDATDPQNPIVATTAQPFFQNMDLPATPFPAGEYAIFVTDGVTGNVKLAAAAVSPCPSTGCGITAVTASGNCVSSGGLAPNITCSTPTPLPSPASGNTNCAWGGLTGLTITCTTPTPAPAPTSANANCSWSSYTITCTTPTPAAIPAHAALEIALGFATGTVSGSTTYPLVPIGSNVHSGEIDGIYATCATVDNGSTIATVYDNGVSIGTITLSAATKVTHATITPASLTAGDTINMAITAVGTATNCGFVADGQQALF